MRSATMLIVPSRYEPGSIVTAEALACGLPVVLSDEVGAGEVVTGPHVRFHRAGDVDGLEMAVRSLLEAAERDEPALRAAARENAEQHFAPAIVISELLEALGTQVGRVPRPTPAAPTVTVCICTRGRPDDLAKALASLGESTYPVSQVVVSDDLDDPLTQRVCREAAVDVDYILGPQRGLGANRNHAVGASTGDVLLFIDDDCLVRPDFLVAALERMRSAELRHRLGRVIVSGRAAEHGRLIAPGDQTFLGFQSRPYLRDEGLLSIVLAATLFPAGLFQDVKFDSRLLYGYEEVDLAIRAVAKGYTIVDCPEAIIEHRPSQVGRTRNLSYAEASRLHVTLRRYALIERAPLRAAAFAIVAPIHHIAANVKQSGLSGIGTAARTFGMAAAMARQSR